MGCAGSQFDDVPVTGHQDRLVAIPFPDNRYLNKGPTVLKLKEKFFSFSGDDCRITDIEGNKVFNIEGEALSMSSKRRLRDSHGTEIAGYRKKLLTMHATAYITIQDPARPGGDHVLVVATIKRVAFSMVASAEIFLHQPPVSIDSVSTDGMNPDINVEGDIRGKKFDFMMGVNRSPFKLAQVVRKFQLLQAERNTYFLEIGPNVDVAFITICAFAIDELFKDDN